ncbi:peptidoglycan recognition protein family protein [Virgibacillus pantothenticus]|uniref:peptidoglycan recognition protein family protein n=1 Tax=Virgibacillus pantothenticus TaxID=1473 RepID=UPI001B39843D|nr:GW dipeptide domain-containing protein [Virgibacillus pantothenticus]QTY15974.1 SH3-like domain-containing protein [Virgibacillus pantothenticus]
MKKGFTIFFIFLLIFSPSVLQAEEKIEEYNELGIKKGTKVYGEDISELSEKELQYVPKGWRDGNVEESEHPHPEKIDRNHSFLMRSIFPDVNTYIKNMKSPSVQSEHKSMFEKFNYRNGYGAVEGVVAHETANDNSTIFGEISYITRNHENAFVHAFVDHERVIQIHPLDYGAWGGGRYANERFVHVELVRTGNFDQFARSINNYASYIANILYDYNLGVTSAEETGKGSLWSHKAVSNHLGGTTHVDPHGYFARYGYNWNQFVSLIRQKHDAIVNSKKANTSKLAHIKSAQVKIYRTPTNLNKYSKAGSKNLNKAFYVKAEAKVGGTNYYLLSNNPSSKTGTIGWVESNSVNAHNHKGVDKKHKTLYVKGTGKAYSKAWGGPRDLVYDLSTKKMKEFKVDKTETVGKNTWYRGVLDGKTVFIHSSYVMSKEEKSTSRLGHIKRGAKIYKRPGIETSVFSSNDYLNTVYYIKKQAKLGNKLYYLTSTKPSSTEGIIGWVKEEDINTHTHKGVDKKHKTLYVKGTGKAYSKAWGGPRDLVYDLSMKKMKEFKVDKTETVGKNTWYRGVLDGKTVFIHSSYVMSKEEKSTSRLGHIKRGAKIYKRPGIETSVFSSNDYLNTVYYIKKQAKLGNKLYYLTSTKPSSTEGIIGWVKEEDINTHTHKGVDKKHKTLYVKGTGKAYSKAWGGPRDLVYDLSMKKMKEFKVDKTETVGKNTWYRGVLDGKTVFIHSSYVMSKEEKSTSRLGHIKRGAKIYKRPGIETSVFSSNDYLNTVYYIKKQAKLGNKLYYLTSTKPSSTEGIIGWVKEEDINTHTHKGVDKKHKTLYVKGTGKAYSKAWGGPRDLVYGLSTKKMKEFKVDKTEAVGKNTWYRGVLDGKTVFIHSSYVK